MRYAKVLNSVRDRNLNCGISAVISGCVHIKYHLDVILNIYILARLLKKDSFHFKVGTACQASGKTVLSTVKS